MSGLYDVTMGPSTRAGNRGPAAAAENRLSLLWAARELFAERGYAVPLSAIARAAGVGQAVLYRHFPRRVDLAFAVFEENFARLDAAASHPGPDAFERLFDLLVEQMVESVGFVELVVGARPAVADYDGDERLAELVTGPLTRAQREGLIAPHVTVDDVALALRMIYGVATTARDAGGRREDASRVRELATAPWRP